MKTVLFLAFFLICTKVFSQDYSVAWAEHRKCSHDLTEIDSKIKALNSEYEKIKKDLSGGYYCSQCKRSKTEIEKTENFEQHLKNVKGVRVPATQQQFDDAHKAYMSKYNSLSSSYDNKKNNCNDRISKLNESAYNKWVDEQNAIARKEEERLQSLEKKQQEQQRLALKKENERLKKQAEAAAAEKIKLNATKEKNQGFGVQNNNLTTQQNIQISESVNNYLDSQADISNSLSQSASEKMNNINSLLNETSTEKMNYIDEIKDKIQSVKELIASSDTNTPINLDDYDEISQNDDDNLTFNRVETFLHLNTNNKYREMLSFFQNAGKIANYESIYPKNYRINYGTIKNFFKQDYVVSTWEESLENDPAIGAEYKEWSFLNEVRCGKFIFRLLPGCRLKINLDNQDE
ncbi:MAG: hypothetical protein QM564_11510 [Bergeyella sp.]